jgi:hypothetical protein
MLLGMITFYALWIVYEGRDDGFIMSAYKQWKENEARSNELRNAFFKRVDRMIINPLTGKAEEETSLCEGCPRQEECEKVQPSVNEQEEELVAKPLKTRAQRFKEIHQMRKEAG